jgi:hypothetical protein
VAGKRKKKKGGRAKVTCLDCGKRFKARFAACPRCGRRNLARASKAVRPAVARNARPRCGACGNTSRKSAAFCTTCGRPFLSVVKAAEDSYRQSMISKMHGASDPGEAQVWWYKATGLRPPWEEGAS